MNGLKNTQNTSPENVSSAIIALGSAIALIIVGAIIFLGIPMGTEPADTENDLRGSTFNCPNFELLSSSEQEEISERIRQVILGSIIEGDSGVNNEIIIAEFPKCFTGSDALPQ